MAEQTAPRTAAGRALLEAGCCEADYDGCTTDEPKLRAAILAIEAAASPGAPAVDVERLKSAIEEALSAMDDEWLVDELAEVAAAEYVRLQDTVDPVASGPESPDHE